MYKNFNILIFKLHSHHIIELEIDILHIFIYLCHLLNCHSAISNAFILYWGVTYTLLIL